MSEPSGQLQQGRPDHPHHGWSPLPARAPARFAEGHTLGLCPVICFESHEDAVLEGWPQPNWMAGGVGMRPDPNIARIGQRDYGLRAGWPRLRHAILDAGLKYAAAMDVMTAETLPHLRDAVARDVADGHAEWIAHGVSVNRPLHDGMNVARETAHLAEVRDRLAVLGIEPHGWFGIEYGESRRTPALLARTGFTFTLDWCNDEQPFPMTVPEGSLTALPQMADLDDAFAFAAPRGITPQSYGARLAGAATELARDGETSARVLLWSMRPFLSGQPFRIGAIERALAEAAALPGLLAATPSSILAAFKPGVSS